MNALMLGALLALNPVAGQTQSAPSPQAAIPQIVAAAQIPTPDQVMEIPPELRTRLRDALKGTRTHRDALDRILRLIFDRHGLNLVYDLDANGTVAETYRTRRMNCLSFSMLFIALARAAGLEVQAQDVKKTLAWRHDSGVFVLVDHIISVVHIDDMVYNDTYYKVDILRDSVFALQTPEPISEARLLAHFYNNLAMQVFKSSPEASASGATEAMRLALDLDPANATNWSNSGVLRGRLGDLAGARSAFERALALQPDNAPALANMVDFYRQQGDQAHAEQYRARLDRIQQADPIFHFLQAETDLRAGDYQAAINHYHRAIRLYGREPAFYAALANAYVLSGDKLAALRELRQARSISSGITREAYNTQIEALQATMGRVR